MLGLASGTVWGLKEGLRNIEGTSHRMRANSILNGLTRRGPYMANTFAALSKCTLHCLPSYLLPSVN